MDAIKELKEYDGYVLSEQYRIRHRVIQEIERLREALLDTFAYVSRADNLFLKESTKNTLKGIPDGHC